MDINQPVFEFPVTICYEDTDVGGLAYHANFLKYFEPCCSEWLAYIGATHKSLREQNSVFVVRHVDKDFLQGARLEDRLIIKANVAKALKASVSFCQEIVNEAGDILSKAK